MFLKRLFLFSCLFPFFVSPYPISSDTQPLAGIFALMVLFQTLFIFKEKISKNLILLLLFSFSL